MSDIAFDENKTFPENCAEFLEGIEGVDSEMAEILKANWDKLLTVVREGERDSKARAEFNEAIACALDDLLTQDADEDDE